MRWRFSLCVAVCMLVTAMVAHPTPAAPGGMVPPKGLRMTEEVRRAAQNLARLSARPRPAGQVRAPAVGQGKCLVGLVDFSDNAGTRSASDFQNMLFTDGTYATGSMADFYRENSYGLFTLTGTVSGWYRAPDTYAHYANGDYGATYVADLVRDLVDLMDPDVDFSQYDTNGDGYVESFFVVHAGPDGAVTGDPNDIWSHQSSITPKLVDGVYVSDYSIEPEDGTIGVFCHEYGHVLGLPDLYDYDGSSAGVGRWCIMATGCYNGPGADAGGYGDGSSPSHFSAWCKAQLGWVTPQTVTGNEVDELLPPVENTSKVLKMPATSPSGSQYFLVENRQLTGFDRYLPGSGVCIFHIDDAKYTSYAPNDDEWYPGQPEGTHPLAAVEQADGLWALEHFYDNGDAGDMFGTTAGTRRFTNTTTPSSRGYLQPEAVTEIIDMTPSGSDFLLDLTKSSFSISGTITYAGQPLRGVTVAAGANRARTNLQGSYTLNGLAAGTYQVTPSLTEYSFTPASASVTVGPDAVGVDFEASRATYVISGTVTDAQGAPMAGVRVRAFVQGEWSSGSSTAVARAEATTDAQGAFSIDTLFAGAYTLVPDRDEYDFEPESTDVTIGPAASGVVFVGSVRTYTASGRITTLGTGTGLAGVSVTIGGETVVTSATGSYRVEGLVAGTYDVTPALEGYVFVPASRSITVGPSTTVDLFSGAAGHAHPFGPGWTLFSLPVEPVQTTVAELFGAGARCVAWNAAAEQYEDVAGQLDPSVAYWVNLPTARTVTVNGAPYDGELTKVVLSPGWQLVGNPYPDKIDWTRALVTRNGQTLSITNAAAQGWISSYAWVYTPQSGALLVHSTIPGARTEIAEWEGFFVRVNQPLTLWLQRVTNSAGREPAVVALSNAQARGFTIPLAVRCGSATDTFNVLGVTGDTNESSALRVAEPPRLPNNVNLSFVSASGEAYAVDLRAAGASEWRWDAMVTTDIPDQRVTVTFDDLRSLPREYEAVLVDSTAGETVFLRTSPVYSFQGGRDGAARRLTVSVRRRGAALRVTGLRAQSLARGTAAIAYTLSAPARVTARVLNAAGRQVAVVAASEAQDAGAQTLSWNGRSSAGALLPPGTYTVELDLTGLSGERTRSTTPLVVVR
ncbi:MAG TPA: M6 family metalloprotease domain-containing protein [Armatimonadota bacterium]|nr:M6 family metalloprotease domain-containing protein [Armatimonadota bacterium]